jgi:hypothetical protein
MSNEMMLIEVNRVWSTISTFAIHEDVRQYINKLDSLIKPLEQSSMVNLTGKSPNWLYMIFTSRIIQLRPDLTILYSKPTPLGNKSYKIYPFHTD